jgi:hypothetical protein
MSKLITEYDEPKVGDRTKYWSSGREDGIATILEIRPYTGRYPQWFKYIVRLTSENIRKGWIETVWKHPIK